MKASEMTNEELANHLVSHYSPSDGTSIYEAAYRLRQFDKHTDGSCYSKLKSSVCSVYSCKRNGDCDGCVNGDIRMWAANDANTIYHLRRRLNVAEDALEKLQDRLVSSVHDGTIDTHEALKIAEDAIAAIREERGI